MWLFSGTGLSTRPRWRDVGDRLPVDALGDRQPQRLVRQDRSGCAVEREVIPAGAGRAPDRDARSVSRGGQLGKRGDPGGVDGVALQGRDAGGVVEHQIGDAVQQRRCAPPFRVALQRDSLRGAVQRRDDERSGGGPGSVELSLVEHLGVRGHALGQQHGVAREHSPPFRKGLGEGDHGLAVVDAAGHLFDAVGAVGAGDAEVLVLTAGCVDLRCDVFPGDGRAIAPDRLGVDGVGDDLRAFTGQFDVGEVVGVDRRRSVRPDPERARHRRPQHGPGIGFVPVDVQRVEVRRVPAQRQPQVAALSQRRGILRVDVAGLTDLGVTAGRRSFLVCRSSSRRW